VLVDYAPLSPDLDHSSEVRAGGRSPAPNDAGH